MVFIILGFEIILEMKIKSLHVMETLFLIYFCHFLKWNQFFYKMIYFFRNFLVNFPFMYAQKHFWPSQVCPKKMRTISLCHFWKWNQFFWYFIYSAFPLFHFPFSLENLKSLQLRPLKSSQLQTVSHLIQRYYV